MATSAKNAKPVGQGAKGQTGTPSAPADSAGNTGNIQSSSSPEQPSNPAGSETSGQSTQPGAGAQDGLSDGAETAAFGEVERVDCLIIAAKTNGFRRAGRSWSTTPRAIPVSSLSAPEVQALVEDPGLVTSWGQLEPHQIGSDE